MLNRAEIRFRAKTIVTSLPRDIYSDSLILRCPRSFAVPFTSGRGREMKGTANDLRHLRIRLLF